MTVHNNHYIIETRCGYFCEPIELKIVNGEKVYYGFLDVPLAIASTYANREAALQAIDRFKITIHVCGIVPIENGGHRKVKISAPDRTKKHVEIWKKN